MRSVPFTSWVHSKVYQYLLNWLTGNLVHTLKFTRGLWPHSNMKLMTLTLLWTRFNFFIYLFLVGGGGYNYSTVDGHEHCLKLVISFQSLILLSFHSVCAVLWYIGQPILTDNGCLYGGPEQSNALKLKKTTGNRRKNSKSKEHGKKSIWKSSWWRVWI